MAEIYGFVNGCPCYSRNEYVYRKRGFYEIESDMELIEFAQKTTDNWFDAGKHKTFEEYSFDFELRENFTENEWRRLIHLQSIAKEQNKKTELKSRLDIYSYGGRPLTAAEVRMFLDERVQLTNQNYGEEMGRRELYTCQTLWKDYLQDHIIPVFSNSYLNEACDEFLWSDGSLRRNE